jgi:hypothetical protein
MYRRRTDPPGGQGALSGPGHPHRYVGLPTDQVFLPVGQRHLDGDLGIKLVKAGQDRRQHLDADNVAGGDADHPAHRLVLPRSRAYDRLGRRGHGLGMGPQSQGGLSGLKTAGGAGEQGRGQAQLQRLDVAADGGLRQAKLARRAGEAAGVDHRQQRAVEIPAGGGLSHTFSYIECTELDNSE